MEKIADLTQHHLRRSRAVGLDIGSSAIRAVELSGGTGRQQLKAVGQVGIEPGLVVEGEVRDPGGVAESLRRLWTQAGFSSRDVVATVAGQRVIVREAAVTAMSAAEFRTAMHFEVQDLIPIPVAEAVLDFEILGPVESNGDGGRQMRILLAAAERRSVQRLLDALRQANLNPVALDVSPIASARAAARTAGERFCLVTVGAELTSVTLRTKAGGLVSRTLSIGANHLTVGLGQRLGIPRNDAAAVMRYASRAEGSAAARAGALVIDEAEPLVAQIAESLDYFQSQSAIGQLERLLIAGGGALTPHLTEMLEARVGVPVVLADAFAGIDIAQDVLAPDDLGRARTVSLAAVGAAMWQAQPVDARVSLLPSEVILARRRRNALLAGVAAVAVLAGGLGALWYHKYEGYTHVRSEANALEAQSVALNASSSSLARVTSYFATVDARQRALVAVGAGVDWPTLLRQISAAMPANTVLGSIQLTATPTTSTTGTTSTAASATATGLAQVTMSVKAHGGVETVAAWLRAMTGVPALTNVWVASSTSDGTTTTFTCNATVGAKAPKTSYNWERLK